MNKIRAEERGVRSKSSNYGADDVKKAKAFIAITLILVIVGATLIALLTLSYLKKLPAVTLATTSNSSSNSTSTTTAAPTRSINTTLQIGASCLYNNQCPQYAFCEGTCKCPFHYYYNTSGICNIRKTNGAGCSNDFECNTNIGLTCQSGTCQCDSVHFWNSTYVLGGGLPNGRCQNQKTYGMYCSGTATNEFDSVSMSCLSIWNSQITRAYCAQGALYYLNLQYGTCNYIQYRAMGFPCVSGAECDQSYSMCMSAHNDGNKRCVPFPTGYEWNFRIYSKF
jgi:hypothetical protein